MSKQQLTLFVCNDKDCCRAWSRICHDQSAGKWLKHLVKEADLPYKLNVIKTECMDRCEDAACVCIVNGEHACLETQLTSRRDADRLLASLRACAESSEMAYAYNND